MAKKHKKLRNRFDLHIKSMMAKKKGVLQGCLETREREAGLGRYGKQYDHNISFFQIDRYRDLS